MHKRRIIVRGAGIILLNVALALVLILVPESANEHSTTPPRESALPSAETDGRTPVLSPAVAGQEVPDSHTDPVSDAAQDDAVREAGDVPSASAQTHPPVVVVPIATHGTVLENMQALRAASSTFTYSGTQFMGLGIFIESINDVVPPDGMYWILYINGESATLGASQMNVRPGDQVEWRVEEDIYR